MDKKSLSNIQRLVGNITEENLKNVDCYVCSDLGLFIPSVGFCEYAITLQHAHRGYSFVMFFSEEQNILTPTIEILPNHYLATAMCPNIPHEEKEGDSFTRSFKQETQVSPIEYLIKLRIEKGKKLLRSSANTITEVALKCGFSSASHFSSCFVKQIGITPTEYQNLYSK